MSEEILINVTPRETRVALVENGVLQEIFVERAAKRGLVGNIYRGKVCRVLPGMQAAFVDVGLERAAFLHASDVVPRGTETGGNETDAARDITQLLHEGQEISVQVIKDPLGTKGARLTTQITIPSRYLVFIPDVGNVGISQKIEDEAERVRLRDIIQLFMSEQDSGGYIARTAAEGATAEALRGDMMFLRKLWDAISASEAAARPGSVIYEDLPLSIRVMRDMLGDQVEKVRIDSRESYQRVQDFCNRFMPGLPTLVEYYPGERPIFDIYGIEDEIHKALERKVQLKSGPRPDRGDDNGRRQYRWLRGASQPGGNHLQDQPRGRPGSGTPAATAQPWRHHHHRFHRYVGRGTQASGFAGAGEMP
jgi:ribonuclease G